MNDQNQTIDPRRQAAWDDEFKQYGIKVIPETAMFYEMESFLPSYAFTDLESLDTFEDSEADERTEGISGRVTFFTRDDKPYFPNEDGSIRWYEIEPMNVFYARMRISDMMALKSTHDGVEGYLIPLQENSFFGCWEDINVYLHNLMFWEGLLSAQESGPLSQRIAWLSQKLYSMRCDQRDSIIRLGESGVKGISIDTDSTAQIIEYALNQNKSEFERLLQEAREGDDKEKGDAKNDAFKILFYKLKDVVTESERINKESQVRQAMYQKQMNEIQKQMQEEATKAEELKRNYESFWNYMKETIDNLYRDDK